MCDIHPATANVPLSLENRLHGSDIIEAAEAFCRESAATYGARWQTRRYYRSGRRGARTELIQIKPNGLSVILREVESFSPFLWLDMPYTRLAVETFVPLQLSWGVVPPSDGALFELTLMFAGGLRSHLDAWVPAALRQPVG